MGNLLCIGHRGAAGHVLENTLASMEKAISLGANWIELDVHYVQGRLIVFHDDRLERLSKSTGYVVNQSFETLRSLELLDKRPDNRDRSIPTLEEVFDLVDKRVGINIELKSPGTAEPVVSLVQDYVTDKGWSYDRIIVSSFNHHEILKAKQMLPEINIGAIHACLPISYTRFAEEINAYSVHPYHAIVTEEYVRDARERGLKIFVWTVDHPEDIARIKTMDIDGIITNYPDRI